MEHLTWSFALQACTHVYLYTHNYVRDNQYFLKGFSDFAVNMLSLLLNPGFGSVCFLMIQICAIRLFISNESPSTLAKMCPFPGTCSSFCPLTYSVGRIVCEGRFGLVTHLFATSSQAQRL